MRKGIFSMCRDEAGHLPIWLNYYSQYFDVKDIYIMDNNTVDGSTKNLPCNVWADPHPHVDMNWVTEKANWWLYWFLKTLTPKYDMMLYADMDEIYYHPNGLDKFMESLHSSGFKGAVRPKDSIEIYHCAKEEPDLDLTKPILQQRKYGKDLFAANGWTWRKATLTNIPIRWTPGFHDVGDSKGYPVKMDNDYKLIHLHFMDYKICLERHEKRNRLHWSHPNGSHGRVVGDQLKAWFSYRGMLLPENIRNINLQYHK